jgi:hypothetical protein
MRIFGRMRNRTRMSIVGIALVVALGVAPAALAAPAVDQYSEGIPTAGGQKPSQDAVGAGSGTATIPPRTQSELQRTQKGAATEKAAELTAPSRSGSGGSSDAGDGLGLLLPLILIATLIAGVGIFVARRRPGPTPS